MGMARRALSNDPCSVFLGATLSEKKIVKKKFFFPLIPLNRYHSAPIGQILIRKIWPCRPRRSLSNDPGPAFVGAIVLEKKIVTEKFFFPLFPLNSYYSVPIGQIFIKKYGPVGREELLPGAKSPFQWPGMVFLGAIVSENKIVKEKFFFPLFHLNRYNSAPIGQILI
ncbi:LOW QUALITY PROTEIN: hypothetical protein V1477_017782 [Vespula maculifrons]|uniref:Uncharacterized protein n=1 Tax=Vespula maculifrons TaxID=7453 RepID=A0ABD2B1C1_VESMC